MLVANWYDNDVRFDMMTRYLRPCAGEKIFEALEPVEDTKGNNGEPGRLVITNLRLIWQSRKYPKINLSIGYNPITSVNIKTATSKLRGVSESLHILSKTRTSRYEFIFTNLISDQGRLFATILAVHRAYAGSKLYREIRMRSSLIVSNKKLSMLPQEEICEQFGGVWNLSSDQGNLGSFIITNVRVVWYASSNELFNASIPFLQISMIKVRESKFGRALVIETTEASGGYVLGFRVDPKEKLYSSFKMLRSIQDAYLQHPVYGVEFNPDLLDHESDMDKKERLQRTLVEEVEEIEDNPEMASDAFAAYFADGNVGHHSSETLEIVYSETLGLAIEKPKNGFTVESLWEVIPSTKHQ